MLPLYSLPPLSLFAGLGSAFPVCLTHPGTEDYVGSPASQILQKPQKQCPDNLCWAVAGAKKACPACAEPNADLFWHERSQEPPS